MRVALGSRSPKLWECCVLLVMAVALLADRTPRRLWAALRAAVTPPATLAATESRPGARATVHARPPRRGSLRVLSYNVAGLPAGISRSRPSTNIPLISPLLNRYDLVLVQEDFAYQHELRQDLLHRYRSPLDPSSIFDAGDGLSRFSQHPFLDLVREAWRRCHGVLAFGSDCLARKGFSVAGHELAPASRVDVYNLHMDAGRGPRDRAARAAQIEQLLDRLQQRSAGRAVIVAGDTNLRRHDAALLERLLNGASLLDSCRELDCPQPGRVDRVLYRSSPELELSARSWSTDPAFRDARGRQLSDHRAVAVVLDWRALPAGVAAAPDDPPSGDGRPRAIR